MRTIILILIIIIFILIIYNLAITIENYEPNNDKKFASLLEKWETPYNANNEGYYNLDQPAFLL